MLHLKSKTHLETFEQKYMESGHSHMEVDFMYSECGKEET